MGSEVIFPPSLIILKFRITQLNGFTESISLFMGMEDNSKSTKTILKVIHKKAFITV